MLGEYFGDIMCFGRLAIGGRAEQTTCDRQPVNKCFAVGYASSSVFRPRGEEPITEYECLGGGRSLLHSAPLARRSSSKLQAETAPRSRQHRPRVRTRQWQMPRHFAKGRVPVPDPRAARDACTASSMRGSPTRSRKNRRCLADRWRARDHSQSARGRVDQKIGVAGPVSRNHRNAAQHRLRDDEAKTLGSV